MNADATTGFESWLVKTPERMADSEIPWLDWQQRSAREGVRAHGIPHAKQEEWRYTSLKALLEQEFVQSGETMTALQLEDLEEILIPGFDTHRVVLVNGRYVSELSALGVLPERTRLDGLRNLLATDPEFLRERFNHCLGECQSLFSALNTAGLDDGFVIDLGPGAVMERPIELIHLSVGMDEPRVAQPRHLIMLGAGAQATLIERYVSLGHSIYCTNSVLEVALGRDASLRHERLQMESPNAFHLTGLYLDQDENSRYLGVNIGLGARWARTDLNVRFSGRHAECDLQGLYLAGDGQLLDYHLDVNHAVPNCKSREKFKGILHGRGRAVFDGRVLVAKDAQKTDAAMSNNNLMLSEQAEVDTKPQLEINADDVKCSHGTTVGQIEPEMLFYLRSRGISALSARRMLCLGFAGEIVERLSSEVLREHVSEQVGQRLEVAPLS